MALITLKNLEEAGLKMPQNLIFRKLLLSYLRVPRINKLYRNNLAHCTGVHFIEGLFHHLKIKVDVSVEDMGNIPEKGPFIVLANHPYGFLDGLIMIQLFTRQFPDFKVLANFFLNLINPLKQFFIPLNPFANKKAMNVSGLKAGLLQLANNQPLGIFPAGEVSTMQRSFGRVEDKLWDPKTIRFIRNANVPVVPVYFEGYNSFWFHLLGKIHPYLRTLSIPAEFFKKEGCNIKVRIGKPILPLEWSDYNSDELTGRYLRTCLYALGRKNEPKRFTSFNLNARQIPQPVVEPVAADIIERELVQLKFNDGLLFAKSNYELYLAKAQQIPNILVELGRLREITFRQVGEGTNKSIDLDNYDNYYRHLFAYDTANGQIFGAYRLGCGDEIINNAGSMGFYVQSLFNLDEPMKPVLSRTLEMGRSFVIKEYQQKPFPLFLLWQGILCFLKANSQYKYLMGPVSISNDFSGFSKDLIIAFIRRNYFNHELAQWVHPKKEFVVKSSADDIELILSNNTNDIQKLDRFISRIEPGAMKVPVLLKQYIKQNARIIGFNVDPDFNDCPDGLMLLDIDLLPPETLQFLQR